MKITEGLKALQINFEGQKNKFKLKKLPQLCALISNHMPDFKIFLNLLIYSFQNSYHS